MSDHAENLKAAASAHAKLDKIGAKELAAITKVAEKAIKQNTKNKAKFDAQKAAVIAGLTPQVKALLATDGE
jgi:hypothetical protein